MSKPPKYWARAKKILSKKDKVMKKLINEYKEGSFVPNHPVFFLNLKKTKFAAATLICWPIILLHNEKKTSLRVTRLPSL